MPAAVIILQRVVNRLRAGGSVIGTKTLVILESWARADEGHGPSEGALILILQEASGGLCPEAGGHGDEPRRWRAQDREVYRVPRSPVGRLTSVRGSGAGELAVDVTENAVAQMRDGTALRSDVYRPRQAGPTRSTRPT